MKAKRHNSATISSGPLNPKGDFRMMQSSVAFLQGGLTELIVRLGFLLYKKDFYWNQNSRRYETSGSTYGLLRKELDQHRSKNTQIHIMWLAFQGAMLCIW